MNPSFVCTNDFEESAQKILESKALDYYNVGAGEQFTLSLNRKAFLRLRIRPRCLRDVSNINTSCEILGCKAKWPVGIAPTAMHKVAHSDGEGGSAKAAGEMGSIFILSSLSTMSIEEVAHAAPDTIKWLQLYVFKKRSLTEQFLERAEKAGFKAIVLTIDSPVFGHRWSDIRNKFKLPKHLSFANFPPKTIDSASNENKEVASQRDATLFDASITWNDVKWLLDRTRLPVIVKGVLTAEDAILARDYGCSGIIVSNHGGRQLDGVPASIEALPEVVRAVGNDYPVMLDGGIRHGNDVFKALALGAKMVFVGRPVLWSLACGGSAGVKDMLQVLQKDYNIAQAIAGCQNLGDIKKSMVVHESKYAAL